VISRSRVLAFAIFAAIAVFVASPKTTFAQTDDPNAPTTPPTVIEAGVTSPPPTVVVVPVVTTTPPSSVPSTTPPPSVPLVTQTTAVPSSSSSSIASSIVPVPVVSQDPASTLVGETTTIFDPNSTTTSSIDPNASTTTTIDPLATTTTVPIITDLQDDANSEPVPNPGFKPSLPARNIAPARNITLENLLFKLTVQQRNAVVKAQKQADEAQLLVAATTADIDGLDDQRVQLKLRIEQLKQNIDVSRAVIRSRGIRVYSGSDIAAVDLVLRSEDSSILARRFELLRRAQALESKTIDSYKEETASVEAAIAEVDDLNAQKKAELEKVLAQEQKLNDALIELQANFDAAAKGLAIAVRGWVFPVQPPFSFVDTYGAPRMVGTQYAHTHQGTDIFAPQGTPLLATSRGVIARKGQAVLGGNKLWLVGEDGTQYYYAHLSAFVEGVEDGTVVEAGQIIGFVGNTGNALTTPAHVHFEIHPGGGGPINPFPTLDAVRRSDANALIQAQKYDIELTPSTNGAGTYRAGIGVAREFAIGAVDASAAGVRSTLPPGSSVTSAPVRRVDDPVPAAPPLPPTTLKTPKKLK
jgi:murein DD-endopeptidase MepM/ murein hydrolase activator NlpD